MNYTQTLEFLFQSLPVFETQGATAYKPGLERITAFCRHIGNPQRNFFTIHVAGTNGKGSVAHIIASVLQQAGYRTGLFTSPHLQDFRERIRVDGEMIPKQKVVNFVDKHHDKMVELELSFFEMTAAMAFDYFAQSDVEVAVIETGLGGRLDATNIIVPILSVITNIGLEHTSLLGDTLPKIAAEKAGIIKKSIPVIIGEADARYNGVIEQAAAANKSRVIYAEQEFSCEEHHMKGTGQSFRLHRSRDGRAFDVSLDLQGNYQSRNIVTASAAVDFLHEETPLTISRRAYLEGMRCAAANTALMGRWQTLAESPLTVCDTGHNAHGIAYVADQLKATPHRELYCVIGFVRDKDLAHILPLLPRDAHYIFTQAHSERALPAAELTAKAAIYGLRGEAVEEVTAAVARAKELAAPEDMIFIPLKFRGFSIPLCLLFLPLDFLPASLILLVGTIFFVAKYMWMTADHLLRQTIYHVIHRKETFLFGDLCMKQYLQQYVPQLFAEILWILLLNSLHNFFTFISKTGDHALMGLSLVPWTAMITAQFSDDPHQFFVTVHLLTASSGSSPVLLLPLQHSSCLHPPEKYL